jgi:hypothetical protein
MKAILKFSIPKEEVDFMIAVKATEYHSTLWDIDQYLRNKIKYNEQNLPEECVEQLQFVRDKLNECMKDRNIQLY